MATSVHLDLTPKILAALRFDTLLDAQGRPAGPTPASVKEWVVRDKGVRGLLLRLTPRTTTWYVQRKVAGAPMRRAMGHWWSADEGYRRLSLTDARSRGRIWLGLMEQGVDPLVEKKKRERAAKSERERDGLTLKVAFEQYVEARAKKGRPSTTTDRKKVSKWMAGSPVWSLPLHDINDTVVEANFGPLLRVVLNGSPRPAWGPKSVSVSTVTKLFAYCSAAYSRAAAKVGLPSGRGVGPFAAWRAEQPWPAPVRRERYLQTATASGQSWLQQLFELRDRAHVPAVLQGRPDPRSKDLKPHTSVLLDFFLCVLLWGSRKEETTQLRWENIDFDRNLVLFPAAVTKSGKTGVVPLTPWGREILVARQSANEIWRPDGCPWVFPSRQHGKPMTNPRSVLLALQKHTGLWITAHDLRRTLATDLGQVRVSVQDLGRLLIVGAALNHSRGATGATPSNATAGYIQEQAEILRPTYQTRENRLRALVGLPALGSDTASESGSGDGMDLDKVLELIETDDRAAEQLLQALLKRRSGQRNLV